MKRKIIDFNTGTQLIGHFAQIFGAGFKLPVIAGLALFAWIAWGEVSGRLGEHQSYLILMKLYAHAWAFMEFDSDKLVNLPSAFGGTFQIAISRVPDFPPVVAAWEACAGALWRALWKGVTIFTPLVALFVEGVRRVWRSTMAKVDNFTRRKNRPAGRYFIFAQTTIQNKLVSCSGYAGGSRGNFIEEQNAVRPVSFGIRQHRRHCPLHTIFNTERNAAQVGRFHLR